MMSVGAARASGMRDERWTNRDKLNQIHGLLSLKKRDIKQAAVDVENLNKIQCDEIKELKREIGNMRQMLATAKQGDAQRIRNILRANRPAQIALRDKPVSAAIEYLEQSNFVKCKDLNSLRCQKIKLMRVLLNLQLEQTRLNSKLEERLSERPDVKQEQTLTNLISRTAMKQDAAASVYFTYTNIVAVLTQDEKYFSPVLDILNRELVDQCKAVLKVTGKGQVVTEEAADIRDECRRYEEKLISLMHDRSEAVNQMRLKVERNRNLCKALLRVESATVVPTMRRRHGDSHTDSYSKELETMESVMQKLRNVTLVEATDDIYPRLKGQISQRDRLKRILARKSKKRDAWLKKRNHAELNRDHIMHNMEEFTLKYKKQKAALLKGVGDKRGEQQTKETEMEKLGRFMVSMRTALFSIAAVLDHVRPPEDLTERSAPSPYHWDPMDDWMEELYTRSFEPDKKAPKDNAMKLLQKIYFKSWLLTEQLSSSKDFPARQRHTYPLIPEVLVEGRGRGDETDEQLSSSILDADDDNDPSVPTRADLKAQSKRIVDYYLKLPEMKPDRKPRKPRPDETKYWCPRPADAN